METKTRIALAVLGAAIALTSGCDKPAGPTGASSSGGIAPEASATSGETGMADCDVFLSQYRCFLGTHMPDAQAEATVAKMRDGFKAAAADASARGSIAGSCREQQAAQAANFARSGCASTDAGAPAEAGAPVDSYPLSAIRAIPESCANAGVLMTSAPRKDGVTYNWQWVRQAMYANKQFRVVTDAPVAPMQIEFRVFEEEKSIHLVASCKDGGTCNHLAAMYKATVRSSSPQPFCGKPPVKGDEHPARLVPPDGVWLPTDKADVVARCARLSACMIANDIDTPGDPGLECQRAPSSFKVDCATKDPCAEVLACIRH